MRVYAYRVAQAGGRTIREVAEATGGRLLADRYPPGGPDGLRLEDSNLVGNHVLMSFSRPRQGHGPGSWAQDAPLNDIDLGVGRRFGEDTAVAFDPATGFAAVQFNQYGPRVTHIQEYLTAADLALGIQQGQGVGFTFAPHYKRDAAARLQQMRLVKEIEFTISVPGVNEADFDAGRSVGGILRSNLPGGLQTISIKLSAGRTREAALALNAAHAIIADLNRLGGDLKAATVTGKAEPRAPRDEVNLVDERLSVEVDIRPNLGHRMALPERWTALGNALRNWQAANQLR